MLGLHLIQNPSGTYSFVGDVPVELAWVTEDGGVPSEEQVKIAAQFGPRFAKVKEREWPTAEEALKEAEALGYTPSPAIAAV